MSLLQDMKNLTRQYDDLYKEQLQDNTINNEKEMKDIQFQLFMLTTKQEQEIQNLVDRLNYYKEKYNQGQPVISDEDYDKLYFELAELEHWSGIILNDSPTRYFINEINTTINNSNIEFSYNYKLINNNKIIKDPYQLIELINQKDTVAIVEPMGIPCFLEYQNGYLKAGILYEKDNIELNITNHLLSLSPIVPRRINYKNKVIIKGYLTYLIDKVDGEELKINKTIHNLILNKIQLCDLNNFKINPFSFFITYIYYGLEEISNLLYPKLCYLNELGFQLAPIVPLINFNKELLDFVQCQSYEKHLFSSNILFYLNNASDNKKEQQDNFLINYQFQEECYKEQLLDIIWTFDNDYLIPKVVHTPIIVNNQTIRQSFIPIRCNVAEIIDFIGSSPYVGQPLDILYTTRSLWTFLDKSDTNILQQNQKKIISPIIPELCPYCNNKLSYDYIIPPGSYNNPILELHSIRCDNPKCIGKQINQIKHFIGSHGLNISNFSEEIIDWLFEKGWIKNSLDLYILKRYQKEWEIQPNFNKDIVDMLLKSIEESKKCSFAKFLSALAIPYIDEKTAIKIANYFHKYENFISNIYKNNYDFIQILHLNQKQQKALLDFDYKRADFLWRILKYGELPDYDKNYFYMPLRQKTYVVIGPTKYFDGVEWLCGYIHGEGGAVVTEVTENVNYVINNDPESDCPENIAARELGIPIITEQEFLGNIY